MGADMALEDINSAGGIKALGGAKLELVYADAGDSTEKAKNAAQRLRRRPAGSGRRHRRLAQLVHAGGDRGHRAGAAAVADPLLLRRDHQSRLQVRLPDLADRRLAGRRNIADRAQAGRGRHRQAAEDDRHHPGQHRLAGQLRQASARRRRARKGRAQGGGRPDLHAAAVGRDAADRQGPFGEARFPDAADLGDAGLQAGARKARRVQARPAARCRWSAMARRSARPNC